MNKRSNANAYDLEERTFEFAKNVRLFIKSLPSSVANNEDSKQLVRASGSIGSNYIEANNALSKKDFIMRIKICRKESKESMYWLKLLRETNNMQDNHSAASLLQEASEFTNIFSSIITKSTKA